MSFIDVRRNISKIQQHLTFIVMKIITEIQSSIRDKEGDKK